MSAAVLDTESMTFPRHLLGECESALLLFCSGRMGAADGHWIWEAGLRDVTCVDWDEATLLPFADAYPGDWDYVISDAFEYVGHAEREWDIVSADAPSQLADRLPAALTSYCRIARKYVVATMAVSDGGEPVVPAPPSGWSYLEAPIVRNELDDGRRFWWLVLGRAT